MRNCNMNIHYKGKISTKKKSLHSAKLYAFIFEKYKQWTWNSFFFLKEQKSKILVASLDFLSHTEFAKCKRLKDLKNCLLWSTTLKETSLYIYCTGVQVSFVLKYSQKTKCHEYPCQLMSRQMFAPCAFDARDTAELHRWLRLLCCG